jgi:hypothetical protein
MRRLFPILLLLGACTSAPLPSGGDASGGPDGATSPDGAAQSCADVASAVDGWLAAHASCQSDADCTTVITGCGLTGVCGAYVDNAAVGPYLSSLTADWNTRCVGPCAVDCPLVPKPVCVAGRCGQPAIGTQAVGDSCTSDSDCATGQCITEAASNGLFPGGYCTIRDCDKLDVMCPVGSTCLPAGDGRSYCLRDCCGTCLSIQCRPGYGCCAGPTQGGPFACAPASAPLCTAP